MKIAIGPVGLLGLIFVTLKLCSVITWSWWWVTLPFWGGLALGLAIFIFGTAIAAILAFIAALINR